MIQKPSFLSHTEIPQRVSALCGIAISGVPLCRQVHFPRKDGKAAAVGRPADLKAGTPPSGVTGTGAKCRGGIPFRRDSTRRPCRGICGRVSAPEQCTLGTGARILPEWDRTGTGFLETGCCPAFQLNFPLAPDLETSSVFPHLRVERTWGCGEGGRVFSPLRQCSPGAVLTCSGRFCKIAGDSPSL